MYLVSPPSVNTQIVENWYYFGGRSKSSVKLFHIMSNLRLIVKAGTETQRRGNSEKLELPVISSDDIQMIYILLYMCCFSSRRSYLQLLR